MKDRKRQRENRRLKSKEELIDRRNNCGVKDLTAYNAVLHIKTNGKAAIVLRYSLTLEAKEQFAREYGYDDGTDFL